MQSHSCLRLTEPDFPRFFGIFLRENLARFSVNKIGPTNTPWKVEVKRKTVEAFRI